MTRLMLGFLLCIPFWAHGQNSDSASQIVFESPISANVFVESLQDQVQKIKAVLADKSVAELLEKKRQDLLANQMALMVQSFGCGAHSGDRVSYTCRMELGAYAFNGGTRNIGYLLVESNGRKVTHIEPKF